MVRSRADAKRAYDRASRWSRLEEPFERRATAAGLELLGARPGERVLELGCGAGAALVALARAVGSTGMVVGLDLSPRMLRIADRRLRRARLHDRTQLRAGDAGAIPFPDASFDAMFASFTLELFDTPEIPLVLAECRRVLRPGGRLALVSLSRAAPVGWPTRLYERLHDRFPATLDCRPIHPRLAIVAAGFEHARSKRVPLWGLRAEAVVACSPAEEGRVRQRRAAGDQRDGDEADERRAQRQRAGTSAPSAAVLPGEYPVEVAVTTKPRADSGRARLQRTSEASASATMSGVAHGSPH